MISTLSDIRAVAFDFDGVFTDNKVYVNQDGCEQVRCDRGDGMGIGLLKKTGLRMVVISTERNKVVAARCDKLRLEYMQSVDDKLSKLKSWLSEIDVPLDKCAFIGNDINDLHCLQAAGVAACPADAHFSVRDYCDILLTNNGGDGAVREFCDMYLKSLPDAENPYNN